MVIFEGTVSHKVFSHQINEEHHRSYDDIVVGLGKICAVTMFAYFFLKVLILIHNQTWALLNTPMGYWYLTEVLGLVLIPCFFFIQGARYRSLLLIRLAAVLAMIGVIINRLNYVFIAYKWDIPLSKRYYPSWIEVIVTLSILFAEIWVFRWIVNRMPVLQRPPTWVAEE